MIPRLLVLALIAATLTAPPVSAYLEAGKICNDDVTNIIRASVCVGLHPAVAIDSHAGTTCMLLTTRNVTCIGGNGYDDNGDTDHLGSDALQVSAGISYFCALVDGGNVDCHGPNFDGESNDYLGGDARAVSASNTRTCILQATGNVVCYGRPQYPAPGFTYYLGGDAIGVSAGDSFSCALRAQGDVTCFGGGNPPSYLGKDAVAIDGAGFRVCMLLRSGNVECLTTYTGPSYGENVPYRGGDAKQMAAGSRHTCALLVDNSVKCWGDNSRGESTPPSGLRAVAISVGNGHSCGLLANGELNCWGGGEAGGPIFERADYRVIQAQLP